MSVGAFPSICWGSRSVGSIRSPTLPKTKCAIKIIKQSTQIVIVIAKANYNQHLPRPDWCNINSVTPKTGLTGLMCFVHILLSVLMLHGIPE